MKSLNYKSVISIDLEDATSVGMLSLFKEEIQPTEKVVINTNRLLDLFIKKKVKITFFVLGEIAECYPKLIRRIADCGHELGIHGYKHRHLNKTTPKRAKSEIDRSKKLVEDITGKQVYGYRAPYLSVNEKSRWIIEVLDELGFIYDSSIIDMSLLRYYNMTKDDYIKVIELSNGNNLLELPPTHKDIFGKNIPILSGGYLRIIPFWFTKSFFSKISKKQPVNMYFHPYEIDTSEPIPFYKIKINKSSLKVKLALKKSRYNRDKFISKLTYFLDNYKFTTMIDLIRSYKIENTNIKY